MKALALGVVLAGAAALAHADGKSTYEKICSGCHATGLLGAPRYGNSADWRPRLAKGLAGLEHSALFGTAKGMPPKAGRSDLPDAENVAAVRYMAAAVKQEHPKPAAAKQAAPAPAPAKTPPSATTAVPPPAASVQARAEANAFNRLLRPLNQRNPPPTEDGIHDATLDGTHSLQPPREAFAALPRSGAGNHVDWVKALEEKKIAPRWDRANAAAEPMVFDLNIVREVKGSMPDVVYPHKQHTEWLDCSNCHPAIFIPQKGANQISMARILLGQACGVCHGKVAFPVSECRLCHSKKKPVPATASAGAGR